MDMLRRWDSDIPRLSSIDASLMPVGCTLLTLSQVRDQSMSPLTFHRTMLALPPAINEIYVCARLEQGTVSVFNGAPIS